MKVFAAAILLVASVLAVHSAVGATGPDRTAPAMASGAEQSSDPLPEGLSVRLEAPDGRTDFMMGEPIVLRLVLSSARPGYKVNMTRMFGPSETVNVTPADNVFRWHGIDTSDLITLSPVSSSGITKTVWVNNSMIIKQPGTYSVSVTTYVERNGIWPTVKSTAVTINLRPMSDAEEAKRLASLSKAIAKTDNSDGLDHRAEVQLACLEGDRAARKKVELYLTGRDDITGIRKKGLALSKNKDLELKLLDEAWRDIERAPDQYLLDQMILLRHLAAGIPVRGWTMVAPAYTTAEVIRAQAETAPYIKEIVATMSRRHGANKTATQAFLDEFKRQNDSELHYSPLEPNT
jgi:hypothetical protein